MLHGRRPAILRSERGQTAADWMGVLLVAAVVIAALVATGVPTRIALETRALVCRIGGEDCDPDKPPPSTCVLDQGTMSAQGSVKITVFRLEGGVRGVREERADGTVKITIEGNAGAGLEFATPSADVDAVAGGDGMGAGQREVSVTANGRVARSWIFADGGSPEANRQSADDFVGDVVDKVKATLDPWPWTDGPDLPEHTATEVGGGVEVRAKGEVGSGYGLEGNLGAGVGAVFERDGGKTVFFELRGGLEAGGAQGSFFNGLSASGDGTVRVGITYDVQGRERSMRVIGTAEGAIDAKVPLDGQLDDTLRTATTSFAPGAGGRVVLDARLDLTDPRNLAAARAFLDGRDPATGAAVSRLDAAGDLYDRFAQDGSVSIQTYATTTTGFGGEFDGTVIGGEFRFEETSADLIDAWYLDHQTGFRQWPECTRS